MYILLYMNNECTIFFLWRRLVFQYQQTGCSAAWLTYMHCISVFGSDSFVLLCYACHLVSFFTLILVIVVGRLHLRTYSPCEQHAARIMKSESLESQSNNDSKTHLWHLCSWPQETWMRQETSNRGGIHELRDSGQWLSKYLQKSPAPDNVHQMQAVQRKPFAHLILN